MGPLRRALAFLWSVRPWWTVPLGLVVLFYLLVWLYYVHFYVGGPPDNPWF